MQDQTRHIAANVAGADKKTAGLFEPAVFDFATFCGERLFLYQG